MATLLRGAVALWVIGTASVLAQTTPVEASVDRATIVRWHNQMQSGGAIAQKARSKLVKHSADAAPYLIEQLKRKEANRSNLVYLMGYLSDAAVPALCAEAAKDTSPVRAEVFEVLDNVIPKHGAPIPAVTQVAMIGVQSADPAVLKPVLSLLGRMRPFTELHLADPAPIGARCALALGGVPRPPVAALLEATLDANSYIRIRAVQALRDMPGRAVVVVLTDLIADQDAGVRKATWHSVAKRFAGGSASQGELLPLLRQRFTRSIGGPTRETQNELLERRTLLAAMHQAGEAALPLYLAVLDLPVSPHYWVAQQTNSVREQAVIGLQGLGPKAAAAIPLLKQVLAHDAMSLTLRKLSIEALRVVGLSAEKESELCWQAYELALTEQPPVGMTDSYYRHFQKMRVELVQAALEGLTSRSNVLRDGWDLQRELDRAAKGSIAPIVAIAAMVRTAWQKPEVQTLALTALQAVGADAHAGEAALLKALSARAAEPECDEAMVTQVVAVLFKYATHHRPPSRANHYLHEPCLLALEQLGPKLDASARRQLIEDLVTRGNVKGAPDSALSRLCVKIDAPLSAEFRKRGMMGRRIEGNLMHFAPELFVADLDSSERGARLRAHQALKSHGVANKATLREFAQLLSKPSLREPKAVFEALAKLQPPPAFAELLRPWLPRVPQAYETLATIQPTPAAVLVELLQAVDNSEEAARVEYLRVRHLLAGMKTLGPLGAAYVPKLGELAKRVPWASPLVAEALPYFGLEGVRAFLNFDPAHRPYEGSAIARQMYHGVDTNTRVAILGLLLTRAKPVDGLDRIIKEASYSREPRIRVAAQLLLANLAPNSEQAIEAMLQALAGKSKRLRHHAVKGLAKNANNPRVRVYLFWLQQDDDERVAQMATDALR